ncbi:putative Ig domain-containing protein [Actinocrinis sp.]|uniref:putative Ig domain-containing protein n=1 Tax=Actinocrinis sp. TaxID=1920516 RepID=UPI0039C893CE
MYWNPTTDAWATSTGAITGTPTATGTSTVTVTAGDATGAVASQSFIWTVAP